MPAFFIENFGCRATSADAEAIAAQLCARGHERLVEADQADVVILNTCTVTAAADAQARDAVRAVHRARPGARIIVTGCYAQRAAEELAVLPGVSHVVGNSHQSNIPALVENSFSPRGRASESAGVFFPLSRLAPTFSVDAGGGAPFGVPAKILASEVSMSEGSPFQDFLLEVAAVAPVSVVAGASTKTRPIFKIQDGCNNRCSYCVIPFVRGRSRSLGPASVIAGIRRLSDGGAREIVLSGINLGSYGRDLTPRVHLLDLVRRILDETAVEQIRFSSIEPMDITRDFAELVASSDRLAPHFHVPLQSGSDRILRAMHRWYRAAHYQQRIELIRENIPHASIGADVIVGFPDEDESDFQATCALIAALPFSYLHVFAFSSRPGTAAESALKCVSVQIIRERARFLRALSSEKAAAFRTSQAGRVARALTLHRTGDGWTEALTGNYLKVRIRGLWPANQWFKAAIGLDAAEPVEAVPWDIPDKE